MGGGLSDGAGHVVHWRVDTSGADQSAGVRVVRDLLLSFPRPLGDSSHLCEEMDVDKDSMRQYLLNEEPVRKTVHYGARKPLDRKGPLIA